MSSPIRIGGPFATLKFSEWDIARAYADHEIQTFMVAIMRQLGVTQVTIPHDLLARQGGAIEMRDLPGEGARFYRIVGELELKEETHK